MSDKTYPVHFKKIVGGFIETRYAHNAKEEEKHRHDGFVADQPLPIMKYPCAMYDSGGAIVECRDAQQKAELIKDGYSEKPVVRKEKPTPLPLGVTDRANRIEALEDTVSDLKEGQDRIMAMLESMNAAKSANKPARVT